MLRSASPLALAALVLCSCDSSASSDDPEYTCDRDVSNRPSSSAVGEYISASMGPNGVLAVYHIPLDDTARYRFSEAGLYLLDGTSKRKLVLNSELGGGIWEPLWSPDGHWIAFMSGDQLFVIRPDGSGLRRLTNSARDKRHYGWSPDSRTIAYGPIFAYEQRGLYLVDVDRPLTERKMAPPPLAQACLNDTAFAERWGWAVTNLNWFRPDKVVYSGCTSDGSSVATYDTTTVTVTHVKLTRPNGHFVYRLSAVASQDRIAFQGYEEDTKDPERFGTLNPDGSDVRWFAISRRTTDHAKGLKWTPDGRLLFRKESFDECRYRAPGYGEFWTMKPDGTDQRRITTSWHTRNNRVQPEWN